MRKITHPFARYIKEAYICLPEKTDNPHGTARHTMDTAFFQLPQGFS